MNRAEDPRRSKPQIAIPPSSHPSGNYYNPNQHNSMQSPSYPTSRSNPSQSPAQPNFNHPSTSASASTSYQQQRTSHLNPSSRENSVRRDSVDSTTSESHRKRAAMDQNDSNRPMKVGGYRSIGGGSMSGVGISASRDKSNTPDSRTTDGDRGKGKEKERSDAGNDRRSKDGEKDSESKKDLRELNKAIEEFIDLIYSNRLRADELEKIEKKIQMHQAQLNNHNRENDDEETQNRISELQTREVKVRKEYESARKKVRAPMAWIVGKLYEPSKDSSSSSLSKDKVSDERVEKMESLIENLEKRIDQLVTSKESISSGGNDTTMVSVDNDNGGGKESEDLGESSYKAIEDLKLEFDNFREEQVAQLAEQSEELPGLIRNVIEEVREEIKLRKSGINLGDGDSSKRNSPMTSSNPKAESRNTSVQPSHSRNSSIQPKEITTTSNEASNSIHAAQIEALIQENKRLQQSLSEILNKIEKNSERCSTLEGINAELTSKVDLLETEIKNSKKKSEEKLKKLENELLTLTDQTNKRISHLQEQINNERSIGNIRNVEMLKSNKEFMQNLTNLQKDYQNCLDKFNELNKDDEFLEVRSKLGEQNAVVMSLTQQVSELKSKWTSLMQLLSKQGEESSVENSSKPLGQNQQQQQQGSKQSQGGNQTLSVQTNLRGNGNGNAKPQGQGSSPSTFNFFPNSNSNSSPHPNNGQNSNGNPRSNNGQNVNGNTNGNGNLIGSMITRVFPPEQYQEAARELSGYLSQALSQPGRQVDVPLTICISTLQNCSGHFGLALSHLRQRFSLPSPTSNGSPNYNNASPRPPQQQQQFHQPQQQNYQHPQVPSQNYQQHPAQKQSPAQGSNHQIQ